MLLKTCTKFICSIYALLTFLLVAAACVVPKGADVYFVNGNHSRFLDGLMTFITNLGTGLLFVPLLVTMLFWRLKYAVLTFVVWVGHGLVCVILKRGPFSYLQRPRALLDNDLLYFVPNVDVHSFHSFPSGHTATIFCLAFLVSLLLRNNAVAIVLWCLAVAVGYSRIYLLQQFLMDVAAGATVGIAVTYFAWCYFEYARLPVWMNQYLKLNAKVSFTLSS